jgi:GH25 family lysozyme M1 (1,4-beta-N-acetylmuramidase)
MTAVIDAVEGVDVSRFQGPDPIDWNLVHGAGKRWTYIQSCRSIDSPDPVCSANLYCSVQAGLIPGLYQRVFPQKGSPRVHALHFLSCLNRQEDFLPRVTLPFAVDYEEPERGGGEWCMEYIEVIREATGIQDFVIYSSGSWFEPGGYIGQSAWQDDPDIHIWVAHTREWAHAGWAPGKPKFQHPKVWAHQYDQKGTCPGLPVARALLDVAMKPLPLISGR